MVSKSIDQMVDNSLNFCIQKPSQIFRAYVPRGPNILRTELVGTKTGNRAKSKKNHGVVEGGMERY